MPVAPPDEPASTAWNFGPLVAPLASEQEHLAAGSSSRSRAVARRARAWRCLGSKGLPQERSPHPELRPSREGLLGCRATVILVDSDLQRPRRIPGSWSSSTTRQTFNPLHDSTHCAADMSRRERLGQILPRDERGADTARPRAELGLPDLREDLEAGRALCELLAKPIK